jgi:hypothetical protein
MRETVEDGCLRSLQPRMTVYVTAASVDSMVDVPFAVVADADIGGQVCVNLGAARNPLEERASAGSGGGGIRTLKRPVTSNGFRDRLEDVDLQVVYLQFASQ